MNVFIKVTKTLENVWCYQSDRWKVSARDYTHTKKVSHMHSPRYIKSWPVRRQDDRSVSQCFLSLCVLRQCVLCVLGFNELKLAVVRSMPLTGPNKEKKLPQLQRPAFTSKPGRRSAISRARNALSDVETAPKKFAWRWPITLSNLCLN